MTDHHTEERQAWLRTFREPTTRQMAWDTIATILGAALIVILAIAGGYK